MKITTQLSDNPTHPLKSFQIDGGEPIELGPVNVFVGTNEANPGEVAGMIARSHKQTHPMGWVDVSWNYYSRFSSGISYTVTYANRKILLCLDPTANLHPDYVKDVYDWIMEESKTHQIFISTYDADLVNYFTDNPESIYVVEKDGSVKRLKNEDQELYSANGLGNAWMQGLIGGVRN